MTLQEAIKYDNLLKHNLMEKATTLQAVRRAFAGNGCCQ